MIEAIIFAVALSMDAFAVAIGLGAKHAQKAAFVALLAALYFGLFQAGMSLLGYLCGKELFGWLDDYASGITSVLLITIGGKMIYDIVASKDDEDKPVHITHKVMVLLALATSIDAIAGGFTLNLIAFQPLMTVGIVGALTLVLSWIGVQVGAKSGTWLEDKAGLMGGSVLLLMGVKMVI